MKDYVLGLLSDEDRIKMEGYIQTFPDIATMVKNMDLSLEKIAAENRINPPKELKEKIISNAQGSVSKDSVQKQKSSMPRASLVAAFVAGCLLTGSFLGFKLSQNHQKTEKLDQAYLSLKEECEVRSQEFAANEELLYFLRHEATVPVNLRRSNTDLIMYHNAVAKQSKVQVRGLPEISADETFQMWADVDGEMISMGIFSAEDDFRDLKFIADPESFNVTIEPAGGSSHPTVSRLVVSAAAVG